MSNSPETAARNPVLSSDLYEQEQVRHLLGHQAYSLLTMMRREHSAEVTAVSITVMMSDGSALLSEAEYNPGGPVTITPSQAVTIP